VARACSWWRRECIRHDLDPDDPRLRPPPPPAPCLSDADGGELAAPEEGLDGASQLGEHYLETLPRSLRGREGRYYTPRPLAALLVEQALRHAPRAMGGRVVDPACGAGSLLAAVAERVVAERPPDEALRWVERHLRGTDLDEVAVWLCTLSVWSALLPAWRRLPTSGRRRLPVIATCADGLSDQMAATLVVANPPFGRIRLLPSDRARFAPALYGHANRATLFLHNAASRLTGEGAAAAFVLPASVVGGSYFQRVRAFLAEVAPPAWLAFVADRDGVFKGDVLQEAVLAVFVRGRESASIDCERLSLNGGVRRDTLAHVPRPAVPSEPWLLPRQPGDGALLERARGLTHRLADYGWRVSTGPLVWNRHRDQLSPAPGPGRLPVIWASDVSGGLLDASSERSGRWCEVLPGQKWLVLDRPAVLVQRTTAPEQPRRLVAAVLDEARLRNLGGSVVVENHINVCTWSGEGPLTPDRLVTYLNAPLTDRLYRCLSGSVAVSAFELKALPLPPPEAWEPSTAAVPDR
jgi:adenine-specific DNA-methyltransferase